MGSSGLEVDSNDLSPLLQIITWLLQCITLLAVLVKIAINFRILQTLTEDDFIIATSLLLSIGQCLAASYQNSEGFGKHLTSLSQGEVDAALKAQYAAQLLWIASICCAKLSLAAFSRRLTPRQCDHTIIDTLRLTVAIWGLASFIAVALQCQLPRTWDYIGSQCYNRMAFWDTFAVINLLSDLALIAIPVSIIMKTQASFRKRIVASLYFSTRLVTIAAILCQLAFWTRTASSTDPTFSQWPVILCRQITLATSIITACIPQFKPLFDNLETGMFTNDSLRRRGQNGFYGYMGHSGSGWEGPLVENPMQDRRQLSASQGSGGDAANDYTIELAVESDMGRNTKKQLETVVNKEQKQRHSQLIAGDEESQHSTSRMIKSRLLPFK